MIKNIKKYDVPESVVKAMSEKLLAGDLSQVCPLIEAHLHLAYKIAWKFVGKTLDKSWAKKESLISEAFAGLVRAVNNAAKGGIYDINITPYIASCVHGYLKDFLAKDHLIPVEKSAFKAMAEAGKLNEYMPVTMLLQEDLDEDTEESFIPESGPECLSPTIIDMLHRSSICDEAIEKLESIKLTETERAIITKMLEGYNYEEIGQQLGHNERYVKYHLSLLKSRLM